MVKFIIVHCFQEAIFYYNKIVVEFQSSVSKEIKTGRTDDGLVQVTDKSMLCFPLPGKCGNHHPPFKPSMVDLVGHRSITAIYIQSFH